MQRYRKSDKGKAAKQRYRQTESYKEEKRRYKRTLTGKRMLHHSFIGVDGEGWTTDRVHHYVTLTVGTQTLHKEGLPLSSMECLAFLSSRPVISNQYYVSFYFDYDVTMILRDIAQLEPDVARKLFVPSRPGEMVWYKGYGIAYRPKKFFKVKRWTPDNSSPVVAIHDVQGFFQSSFVVALNKFDIGTPEQRQRIADMKQRRSSFTSDQLREIIGYSEEECRLLAELVAKLRDATHLARINAAPYEGPGDMARRALDKYYGKNRHTSSLEHTPNVIHDVSTKSYYGGRFEILAHGPIGAPVYEYDIKSAYPYAMSHLPCLIHGSWKRGIHSPLYLAEIEWQMVGGYGKAMPFPVRRKDGTIYYPTRGHGWYWSHELHDGISGVTVLNAWSFMRQCDCQPFAWVPEIYLERLAMEADKPGSGIALKLMLNTLYGKLAQQRPVKGTYFNMVYASLITSMTRGRVYRAYLDNPKSILMFATDAVFSTLPPERIKLDAAIGTELGQWEIGNNGKPFTDMVIFQPGVYFDGLSAAFKTRGVPKQIFRDNAPTLRANALNFDASVEVTLESHLSMRLALSRGTPHAIANMGNWLPIGKRMCSSPHQKRDVRLRNLAGIHYSKPLTTYGDTYPYSRSVSEEGYASMRLDDDLISDGYYEGDF